MGKNKPEIDGKKVSKQEILFSLNHSMYINLFNNQYWNKTEDKKRRPDFFSQPLHTMQYSPQYPLKFAQLVNSANLSLFTAKSLNPSSPFIPTQIPDPSMKALEFHLPFEFQVHHFSY